MQEEIERILHINDYYELMGVSRDCGEQELKEAYHLLAVKFHPDKNREVGAREVFMKITTAYYTLLDRDRRANYDRQNRERQQAQANEQRRRRRRREVEFDFEEVFTPFLQKALKKERAWQAQQKIRSETFSCFELLMMLVLVLMIIPTLFKLKPDFSFQRSEQYSVRRATPKFRVIHYASQDYIDQLGTDDSNQKKLDKLVDREYIRRTMAECELKKEQKKRYIELSLFSTLHREAYLSSAQKTDFASCHKLSQLRQKFPDYFLACAKQQTS